MRIIILALVMLAIVFFIPKEKCTIKVQAMALFFLVAVFAFTVFKEVYSFDQNLQDLLLLGTNRLESTLSMLAVYVIALCNVIIFLKSTLYKPNRA